MSRPTTNDTIIRNEWFTKESKGQKIEHFPPNDITFKLLNINKIKLAIASPKSLFVDKDVHGCGPAGPGNKVR